MFKKLLRESDRPLIGTFVKLPTLEVAEMLATAGFGFVVIDTEHALLSVRDVYTMVVGYSRMGVAPLVRVTDHGYGDAQRYLDAGAAGILVPHVENAAVANEVFPRLLFPPQGTRGMGASARAGLWGALEGGTPEYIRVGTEDVARIAMIEDPSAIDAMSEILKAPGLDGVFIGPGDLSLSQGLTINSPEIKAQVSTAISTAVAAGTPVGTVVGTVDAIRQRLDEGCSFVMVSNDTGMMLDGAKRAFAQAREALEGFTAAR